jgi:hypothetical protein
MKQGVTAARYAAMAGWRRLFIPAAKNLPFPARCVQALSTPRRLCGAGALKFSGAENNECAALQVRDWILVMTE